jgi:DNA-binding TFAR19-related protein (PDSD5 family)
VCAQARLHANNARRQFLEFVHKGQALDLAANGDLADRIKAHEVKDILANIDTKRGKVRNMILRGIRHGMLLLLLAV